jgi:glutamate 5-kinase
MSTKVDSALIATGAGIPTVVAGAADAAAALAGEPVGTYFAATGRRPRTRLLWLAHVAVPRGQLYLDQGAVDAVVGRHASLLPAGITKAEGSFEPGDPVDLCAPDGAVVARGLVNFDSTEMPTLMGRSTRWLARERGHEYEREIIHRDDMVVFSR